MKNVLFFSICLASAIAGCSTISTKEYPTLERARYACNAWKDRGTLYAYLDSETVGSRKKGIQENIERLIRRGYDPSSPSIVQQKAILRDYEQRKIYILDYESSAKVNWFWKRIHSRMCNQEGSRYVGYANEVLDQGAVGISVLDIGEHKAKRYFDVETD